MYPVRMLETYRSSMRCGPGLGWTTTYVLGADEEGWCGREISPNDEAVQSIYRKVSDFSSSLVVMTPPLPPRPLPPGRLAREEQGENKGCFWAPQVRCR